MGVDLTPLSDGFARVSGPLATLASALAGATTIDEVMECYLNRVRSVVPTRAVGIYLSRGSGRPPRARADGVSEAYLETYEEVGRPIDPVLQEVLATQLPCSSSQLMSRAEWQASDFYIKVLSTHALQATLKAPIIANQQIIGTLNFGDRDPDAFDAPGILDVAGALGHIVGLAVNLVGRLENSGRERDQFLHGFESTIDPLIVTDLRSGVRHPNTAARRVMSLLPQAEVEVLLEDLLTGIWEFRQEAREYGTDPQVVAQGLNTMKDRKFEVTRLSVTQRDELTQSVAPFAQALLSPRERQVAAAVSLGLHDQQIADSLVLSVHTVKQHLKSIYKKLGVNSRVELTRVVLLRRTHDERNG